MQHMTYLIFLFLHFSLWADVEISDHIIPIEVFYRNKSVSDTFWIGYNNNRQGISSKVSSALQNRKKPIPGTALLYANKLVEVDTLLVSRKLHRTPDSLEFLVQEYLPLEDIEIILDATSDSLESIGTFTPFPWLDSIEAELMLDHKPLAIREVVLEEDVAYWSLHFYLFDATLLNVDLEKIVKKYEQSGESFVADVKKAVNALGRAVVLEEASP